MQIRPGRKGDFLVKCDGETLWDKLQQGSFPDESDLLTTLQR